MQGRRGAPTAAALTHAPPSDAACCMLQTRYVRSTRAALKVKPAALAGCSAQEGVRRLCCSASQQRGAAGAGADGAQRRGCARRSRCSQHPRAARPTPSAAPTGRARLWLRRTERRGRKPQRIPTVWPQGVAAPGAAGAASASAPHPARHAGPAAGACSSALAAPGRAVLLRVARSPHAGARSQQGRGNRVREEAREFGFPALRQSMPHPRTRTAASAAAASSLPRCVGGAARRSSLHDGRALTLSGGLDHHPQPSAPLAADALLAVLYLLPACRRPDPVLHCI